MYLLLEHDGTPEQTAIVKTLSERFEDHFGGTTEEIVSTTSVVTLYDENQNALVQLNKLPSESETDLLFSLIDNED